MKDRVKNVLKNLDAYFAAVMFAVTLVIVVVNVFMRYFVGHVISWGEEVATTCFVYTVFVGAAWCLRTHQHMGVDLLVDKLKIGARRVVHLITDIIVFALNSYVTYLSILFTISSKTKTMPILKVSSVVLNFALILGFGLMAIYSLVNCVEDVKLIASGKGEIKDGEDAE